MISYIRNALLQYIKSLFSCVCKCTLLCYIIRGCITPKEMELDEKEPFQTLLIKINVLIKKTGE